jgi:ABC-type glycerol-3-phosphate transport system permease component
MKRDLLMVVAALHAILSFFLFFGLMASSLRDPDSPATPWQDAVLLAMFLIVFFPSLALQRLGIDLWRLSLLVILPNTVLWVGVVSLAAWAARKVRRSRQRTA